MNGNPESVACDTEPDGYRYLIEGILFLTYMAFGLSWSAAGTFLTEIMADLDLSLSHAGFINTSVSLAKIFGPAAAGFVLLRMGLKNSFLLASALICMGILAPFAGGFPTLLLARFTMGLGGALAVVCFTPLVMEWFEPSRRATINGLNYVSISCGMMLGLLFTRPLMNLFNGSWRSVLLVYGMISVLLLIAWIFLGREGPRTRDSAAKTARAAKENDQNALEKGAHLYLLVLRDANTWKLVFTYGGLLSLYMVIITYLPTLYRVSERFTPDSIVHIAPSLTMFSAIPATIAGIWISNKSGRRMPAVRLSGIMLPPGFLGLFLASNPALVLGSALVCGFGMFAWRAAFFSIPQELPGNTPRRAGYMMGVFWSASYIIATFNTYLTGKIIELSGDYERGFLYIAVISSSMFIGSFTLPETGNGNRARLKHVK